MALGYIKTLSIYWKTIIEMYLLKRVEEDLDGSTMRRQVAQMLRLISSMLTTLNFILKSMHVTLLLYL